MADGRLPESRPATRNPVLLALVGLICIAGGVALVRWQSFLFGPSEPPVAVTAPQAAPSTAPVSSLSSAAPPAGNAVLSPAAPGAQANQSAAASPLAGSARGARAAPATPGPAATAGAVVAPSAATLQTIPAAPPAGAGPKQALQPSFDVVRVDRAGHTVIAGRAPAGSTVTVTAGQTIIGTTTADPEGQWVLAPDKPLPSGGHTLALAARLPNGPTVPGSERVVAVVPQQNAAPPVALLDTPAQPRLIEAPPPAGGGVSAINLDLIQYGAHGAVSLAGRAPPNTELRIYLDNHLLGDVRADASGHWALALDHAVAPGMHQVRLDQIAPGGKVLARLAVPFDRTALPMPPGASDITVVQPGQCLWLIAQRVYGNGVRYTLIFQANRSQIRNPNLIYPGQVFTLPAPESAAGAHG